jgi:predicted TPR repeat methyltransferase
MSPACPPSTSPFFLRASFEHSLVKELGYTGYERLRRGFDRAFGGQEKVPSFSVVVDAGCGTGLVGEQVCTAVDHYHSTSLFCLS